MEKEIINVNYNGHKIVADILPANSKPQVICLHGAGMADRKRYDPLRQLLLKNNISSCALDFLGYGETGGDIKDSSLKSRTEQAQSIIEKVKLQKPAVIIGTSMGGFNAIKLTELYEVKLLVLIAPAVFDVDAYNVNFGPDFSSVIRKERSWDNTDAWKILNKFKGKILIIAGSEDEVIPAEIFSKIYNSSTQASFRELITIPGAPHGLMSTYFPQHPEDLKMVVDKIISLLD